MSKRKSTAPYNNLKEIEYRKQQLRDRIRRQERILMKDIDQYDDDIETFKRLWSKVKGVRHLGQNLNVSNIAQAVRTVRSLPVGGKKAATGVGGKASRWLSAFTLGSEVAKWIIQRRRSRKK
ncbi:MAG: hypothetical protein J5741_02035 [Bacteroidales bacterium]|nr:hypothetical protein [Bacteroidales bacterium]